MIFDPGDWVNRNYDNVICEPQDNVVPEQFRNALWSVIFLFKGINFKNIVKDYNIGSTPDSLVDQYVLPVNPFPSGLQQTTTYYHNRPHLQPTKYVGEVVNHSHDINRIINCSHCVVHEKFENQQLGLITRVTQ